MKTIINKLLPAILTFIALLIFNFIFLIKDMFLLFSAKHEYMPFVYQLFITLIIPAAIFLIALNIQYLKIIHLIYKESIVLVKNLLSAYFNSETFQNNIDTIHFSLTDVFGTWLEQIQNKTAKRLVIDFLNKIPFKTFYIESRNKVYNNSSFNNTNISESIMLILFSKLDDFVENKLSTFRLNVIAAVLFVTNIILTFLI